MNASSRTTPPFSQQDVEFLQVLAFLYVQNNQPRDAVNLLKAIDQAGHCHGYALIILALAQLRSGASAAALTTLDRVELNPELQASYYVTRSKVLAALGRHEDAKAAMRTYVALTQAHKPPAETLNKP